MPDSTPCVLNTLCAVRRCGAVQTVVLALGPGTTVAHGEAAAAAFLVGYRALEHHGTGCQCSLLLPRTHEPALPLPA